MHRLLYLCIAAALMASCHSSGGSRPTLGQRLDSLMAWRYGSKADSAPGCAVVIALGDSIVYEHYQGLADMRTRQPVDSTTRFCIASVSKQFTVMALMQQVQRGLVSLDDSVSRWYPEYDKPFWGKITLADLAGHTSGLPDDRDRSDRTACVLATDSSSVLFFASVDNLKFKPGTAYDYQNPTFLLLAGVVEKASGTDFCTYARRHLFRPAGMDATYYFDPDSTPPAQAHAYAPDAEASRWDEYDYGEETFFATRPDGGIYSTARDMTRWQQALARDGVIVADSLIDLARTPRIDVSGSPWCDYQRRPYTSYGLGWFIEREPGQPECIYHTGDNGGFQAYVAWYPSAALSIVVLENRHDRDRRDMAVTLRRILREEGLL